MFIYAIGNDGNRQKIGISNNPEKRLRSLQTGNPDKLMIHYIFEVDDRYAARYEAHIHSCHRYKKKVGEWFDMTKEEVVDMLIFHEMMMESEFAKNGWF